MKACYAAFLTLSMFTNAFAAPGVPDVRGVSGDGRQTVISVPGPLGPLQGTLLVPENRSGPSVLIVPGSGAIDRDGNGPAVGASTYRLLAEGLSSRGIATLRIDKRGLFGSAKAVADPNNVTTGDYATDVKQWMGALRRETGAKCIWLLGHSEGGLISLIAGRDENVCGLVLVATAGRPMGRVLRDQLMANPANAPLLSQALPAIAALEEGKRVDTTHMHPALMSLFNPAIQGFLIDAFAVDPARLIKDYAKPVLLLQGRRDLQVTLQDAELLHKAAPAAERVELPDANHVLKTVRSEDVASNIATYENPSLPLASGVIDAIAAFVDR